MYNAVQENTCIIIMILVNLKFILYLTWEKLLHFKFNLILALILTPYIVTFLAGTYFAFFVSRG